MTSRERFLTALRGQKADRTPLAHISALTTVELQKMTGCFMPEVHHNPEQLARLCAANHEILGFDAVTFIINYFGEPAALGCEMDWGNPRQLPMFLSHPWQKIEDASVPADLLDRDPIRSNLETIGIAKKKYGGEIAVLGKVMGPFSMTQVMHGVEKVMMGLSDDPRKIAGFIELAADILVQCANAQFDAGIDALAIGEGGAGANMLSPEMYKEVLFPCHKRMINRIHGPTILHICGDITSRLPFFEEIGITCFNFDWAINPKFMKKASEGKFRIMGNINTTDLLTAKPEKIKRQVIENIKSGTDIISPGCAVSPECPNENFRVMAETIKNWGE